MIQITIILYIQFSVTLRRVARSNIFNRIKVKYNYIIENKTTNASVMNAHSICVRAYLGHAVNSVPHEASASVTLVLPLPE